MRTAPAAAALAAALAVAAPARAEVSFISVEHSSFSPARLDVLVGDSVNWRNASLREHDIRSEAAGFDSGRVGRGASFAHTFAATGTYPYVCTIHDGMTGEVGVHPLLLAGPRAPVARGAAVALHVRVPAGVGEVAIEEEAGGGFRRVATATPGAGGGHQEHDKPGTLHATITARASAFYRAVGPAGASAPVRVEVTDRTQLSLREATRRGGTLLRVSARPAQPGARVVLQLRLRERFGWWPVARRRLGERSTTRFMLRQSRPARARVVLVGADWVTVLAASGPLRIRPPGRGR